MQLIKVKPDRGAPMNKLFENEQLFEQVNIKMTRATASLAPSDFPKDFVLELYCECANKICDERISVAYDEYKRTKTEDLVFVIKPEHYLPEFERIVNKMASYWVIKKRPEKLSKQFEV